MWKWVLGAAVLGGAGYIGYDYYRAGFASAPALQEGDFLLSYKSGFRAVMRGIEDEQENRRYFGIPSTDVPSWYKDTWSICRRPSEEESEAFKGTTYSGPGSRLDAVCEIDADGDIFVRGWIVTVPDLR
jgi:hypothetical protein